MPLRDIVLALAVVVVWGVNFVAIKWGLAEVSPFMLTALRYIGCVLPAVFFVRRPPISWWMIFGYGLFVGVLQFSFLFTAIKLGMPAGLASLVMQVQVFFTMALAVLLLGERPNLFQVGGALVAFGGIGVIALERLEGAVLIPLLTTLAAAFFWAISNIINKRAGKVDMLGLVVWGSLVPPIPMLALAYVFDGPQAFLALGQLSLQGFGSIAFIAYASTLFGYGGWAVLLGRHPASTVAPFALLVPVAGFGSTMLLLGETVSALEIAGSVLIFAGLLLNVFGPRLRRRWQAPVTS